MQQITYNIRFHEIQRNIFNDQARFKVISKGRRFGLTHGYAKYVIKEMLKGVSPVLWVDTIYGNIERYFRRYFEPELKEMNAIYRFRSAKNDLTIFNSVCDFRSADKPENIEGFGYRLIIINEAGIVLKNKNLWLETIYPMTLDYIDSKVIIGGTPKGKYHNNEKHLFYELANKNKKEWKFFQFSTISGYFPSVNPYIYKAILESVPFLLYNSLPLNFFYWHFLGS